MGCTVEVSVSLLLHSPSRQMIPGVCFRGMQPTLRPPPTGEIVENGVTPLLYDEK